MDELDYIDNELKELQYYKYELREFFYIESILGKLQSNEFKNIVDELERLAIEIAYLENQKTQYNYINC